VSVAITVLGISNAAVAATIGFDLDFSASQSLWQGGPSAGFDVSGSFGGSAGISYEAVADLGTVAASVNGLLEVQHPDVLPPNTAASINFQYVGDFDGGSLASMFGANVSVEAFIPCVLFIPFTDICVHPRTISLLDAGFLLNPETGFTPAIGSPAMVGDVDNAIGIGPNIDLGIGELGAEVNVDLAQSIALTPTGIDGLLRYENRDTGITRTMPFTLDADSIVELTTDALGVGLWDFAILDLGLDNEFRNDINLDIRPTINYIIDEWPPPGSPLFSVGLLDETFALDFGAFSVVDAFTVQVIPEPGRLLLVGAALVALGFHLHRNPQRKLEDTNGQSVP
jgi:hypothetical protein